MDFARPEAIEAFLHLNVYKELQEAGVSGATVCVAKLGRYCFTLPNCYGFTDATRGVVLDPRCSLFDLGGCAKMLAALALLQLLQESGLTVGTDVNSLLPPILKMDTSRFGSVTVQHLLTHTSGVQRGDRGEGAGGPGVPENSAAGPAEEYSSLAAGGPATVAEPQTRRPSSEQPPPEVRTQAPERGDSETIVMSYLLAQPLYCARQPGTYRPSDVDYMLIGAIIEHLTGEPYDMYIKVVLLEPLGVRLPHQLQVSSEDGAAIATATPTATPTAVVVARVDASDGLPGDRPSVFVHVGQQALEQARYRSQDQAGYAGVLACEAVPSLEYQSGQSAAATDKKVLAHYDPPPLTPVGGLVLTAVDIGRLLPLFLHNAAAAGGDQDVAGSGVAGRSLLSCLYEIRLYDFLKDVGVAYGGLVSLGLGHCGDRVVSCESPQPPPSTREIALSAQAAAHVARAAAAESAVAEAEAGGAAAAADSQGFQDQDQPQPRDHHQQQQREHEGKREQQQQKQQQQQGQEQLVWPTTAALRGGGGGSSGGGGGATWPSCQLSHPSLLLVAPDSGFALAVSCNTAGQQGMAFCRKVATKLLERYRPAELPRSVVRSWLAPVPPPREAAIVHLVAFPPACCLNPITFFEGWTVSMPDFIKLHCMQAPGHGTRRHEPCEVRLDKMVGTATAALLAGLPADAPLALFGHGFGALWAFEVARRLECVYQRQLLHLFVCACADPSCFPPSMRAAASGTALGAVSGSGGGRGVGESGTRRFQTWWLPDQQRQVLLQQKQQQQQLLQQLQLQRQQPHRPTSAEAVGRPGGPGAAGDCGAADIPELYELQDEMFISACRNHPRFPRQLRQDVKAILDHLPLLRADIEAESRYTFLPPVPSLCASVAAVLASVQNRADDEARISQGFLSCPITVLTPEKEVALGLEQTGGWEQVTTGPVRFQAVAGDYHCLEDRRTRGQVVAAITAALGRQMSVHTPWLAKLRPERAGGRWAGSGGGRPSGGTSRPTSAMGGYGGGGLGAGPSGPVLTLHLPPMYPRG